MNDQDDENYNHKEDNTEINVGSPLQYSQKMKTQDDYPDSDYKSITKEKADLPKSLKKSTVTDYNKAEIEYTPENPEFDFESLKASPNFRLKSYPEATYLGEMVDGQRQGRGIMKYNTNRVYEGEWVDDIRCGKGYERYTNNNTYIGEFK